MLETREGGKEGGRGREKGGREEEREGEGGRGREGCEVENMSIIIVTLSIYSGVVRRTSNIYVTVMLWMY